MPATKELMRIAYWCAALIAFPCSLRCKLRSLGGTHINRAFAIAGIAWYTCGRFYHLVLPPNIEGCLSIHCRNYLRFIPVFRCKSCWLFLIKINIMTTEDDPLNVVPVAVTQALDLSRSKKSPALSKSSPLVSPLGGQTLHNYESEYVVFCEHPYLRNGFSPSFLVYILKYYYNYCCYTCLWLCIRSYETNIITLLMGSYLEEYNYVALGLVIGAGAWIAFLLLMILLLFKWDFFGYRVVTNLRAAIIIPQKSSIYLSFYDSPLFIFIILLLFW